MVANSKLLFGKKVLVTCGPTWVPIDLIRVISNTSTGQMGHLIAIALKDAGAAVTLLEGPVTDRLSVSSVKVIKFAFYDELQSILRTELKKSYDALIHCAAVSDYRLKKVYQRKLSSRLSQLNLSLVPTEKMISGVKKINPKIFLVGFKLEPDCPISVLKKKALSLAQQAGCDLVVANTSSLKSYRGYILSSQGETLSQGNSKETIAKGLPKILCQKI